MVTKVSPATGSQGTSVEGQARSKIKYAGTTTALIANSV
jgi:hypothetical protein